MMRLIPVCLPLVLAPLIVAGQQAQPTASQKPDQASAAKQTSSNKSETRHRAKHHARTAATRKSAKRAEVCGDFQIPVDVIMGAQVRHVCLDKAKLAGKEEKPTQGQLEVEVINGPSTDMQYFSDKNQETAHNQPVVVGVESSETRYAGGNKNPVVTGVTSSSSVDATSASNGGQPVTKQVSPRPRRPAYQPDVH